MYSLTIHKCNFCRKGVTLWFYLLQDKKVSSSINRSSQQALYAVSHPPCHSTLSHTGSTASRQNAAEAKGLSPTKHLPSKACLAPEHRCQLLPLGQMAQALPGSATSKACLVTSPPCTALCNPQQGPSTYRAPHSPTPNNTVKLSSNEYTLTSLPTTLVCKSTCFLIIYVCS